MELSDGFLALSYNLGCGNKKVLSTRVYDTGKEFSVSKTQRVITREELMFKLEVKTSNTIIETLESSERCIKRGRHKFPANFVYWGGIDNRTLTPKNV